MTPDDMIKKLLTRLYRIYIGDEEYIEGNWICLSGGVRVLLEDDYGLDRSYSIEYREDAYRWVILKKNPDLCKNLTWYSLVSGNIEIYRLLRDIFEGILIFRKRDKVSY